MIYSIVIVVMATITFLFLLFSLLSARRSKLEEVRKRGYAVSWGLLLVLGMIALIGVSHVLPTEYKFDNYDSVSMTINCNLDDSAAMIFPIPGEPGIENEMYVFTREGGHDFIDVQGSRCLNVTFSHYFSVHMEYVVINERIDYLPTLLDEEGNCLVYFQPEENSSHLYHFTFAIWQRGASSENYINIGIDQKLAPGWNSLKIT